MLKKSLLFIISIVLVLFFSACSSNKTTFEWKKNTESTTSIILNEIQWTAHWEWFYKHESGTEIWENKVELMFITASYVEKDKSSKYYKELAYRHGDSSVYVNYNYSLKGTPVGDNWFSIEQVLSITNGWDESEIFLERTIRFEEKLIFETPMSPTSP